MDTKSAVVIGFFLVLASAIIAFGPRFVPPSNAGNTELTQVKDELAKLRAAVSSTTVSGGKSADPKWARSVAEDFLRALKDGDGKAAYGLLAPDYRDRLTENERKEAKIEFGPFERRGDCNAGTYRFFAAWSITGEELAPNGIEAKLTGKLTYPWIRGASELAFVPCPDWNYPFTLLITRGKDSDLWRVSLFVIARERDK